VTWHPPATDRGSGLLEIGCLLLMTLGAVILWVLGPLLGVGFAWASRRWTRTDKLVATAIVAAGLVTQVALFFGLFILAGAT
jgi:hypothetical protein